MKIRTGFVSNSSSTCFICGGWCDEDDDLCDACAKEKKGKRVFARDFLKWLVKTKRVDPSPAYFEDEIVDRWIKDYLKDGGV
jgi:hypothetical protein